MMVISKIKVTRYFLIGEIKGKAINKQNVLLKIDHEHPAPKQLLCEPKPLPKLHEWDQPSACDSLHFTYNPFEVKAIQRNHGCVGGVNFD